MVQNSGDNNTDSIHLIKQVVMIKVWGGFILMCDLARALLVDVGHTSPQAISPQTRCGLIRLLWQDMGVADLGD
jgi:hypothetical protein